MHRLIKESVKRVLMESAYDINSPEYKQMYDDGADYHGYDEYKEDYGHYCNSDPRLTPKEIADYEALPEKARHPYGDERPDFSNRRGYHYEYGDKLAQKRPNSVLRMQQDKEEMKNDPLEKMIQWLKKGASSYKLITGVDINKFSDEELYLYAKQLLDRNEELMELNARDHEQGF